MAHVQRASLYFPSQIWTKGARDTRQSMVHGRGVGVGRGGQRWMLCGSGSPRKTHGVQKAFVRGRGEWWETCGGWMHADKTERREIKPGGREGPQHRILWTTLSTSALIRATKFSPKVKGGGACASRWGRGRRPWGWWVGDTDQSRSTGRPSREQMGRASERWGRRWADTYRWALSARSAVRSGKWRKGSRFLVCASGPAGLGHRFQVWSS